MKVNIIGICAKYTGLTEAQKQQLCDIWDNMPDVDDINEIISYTKENVTEPDMLATAYMVIGSFINSIIHETL